MVRDQALVADGLTQKAVRPFLGADPLRLVSRGLAMGPVGLLMGWAACRGCTFLHCRPQALHSVCEPWGPVRHSGVLSV